MADDARAPQRRRGKVLEDAIVEAAWQEIKAHGWTDFSMARTAERAGASKKSLYARWPDKGALIAATLMSTSAGHAAPVQLAGDLRTDLRGVLVGAAEMLAGPMGAAVRGLYSALPSLPPEYRALADDRRPARAVLEVLARAAEDGSLGRGEIAPRVAGLGPHLAILHFLGRDRAPDDEAIDEILDLVWIPALRAAAGDPGGGDSTA